MTKQITYNNQTFKLTFTKLNNLLIYEVIKIENEKK